MPKPKRSNPRLYWLITTRLESNARVILGLGVYGVGSRARGILNQMAEGDIAILYLAGAKRILGAFHIASLMFEQHTRIWAGARQYPWRIRLRSIKSVEPERAPSIKTVLDRLELGTPAKKWGAPLQSSVVRLNPRDGRLLLSLLNETVS